LRNGAVNTPGLDGVEQNVEGQRAAVDVADRDGAGGHAVIGEEHGELLVVPFEAVDRKSEFH
jgi:hypothetical protein